MLDIKMVEKPTKEKKKIQKNRILCISTYKWAHIYMRIYTHIRAHTHTNTQTLYIYIYIYTDIHTYICNNKIEKTQTTISQLQLYVHSNVIY